MDPLRETLICQQDLTFLERTPGGVDTLVPVSEAKRYDFGAGIFCRAPTCLESPGRGEDGAFCSDHQSLSLADMPALIPYIDLDTASRVPEQASSESAETVVTPDAFNGFVVLNDGQAPMGSPRIGGGVGLVYARRGKAMLVTATPSGPVAIAVTIGNLDPGADHRFDDIVEIDFIARTPDLYLAGPFEFVHARLPDLPAGTGAYRCAITAAVSTPSGRAGRQRAMRTCCRFFRPDRLHRSSSPKAANLLGSDADEVLHWASWTG